MNILYVISIFILYNLLCAIIIQSIFDRKFTVAILSNSSLIGFCERSLYLFGIINQQFEMISAILLVKTIIRFPEISQKDKTTKLDAEKYILGTMLNLLLAIVYASIIY